jgi:hypothetical protein
MTMTMRQFAALAAFILLAACGGGGGSSNSSSSAPVTTTPTPTPTPALTNFVTVTVDQGPSALRTGGNNLYAYNQPYVSVTLCAPGTSNCQTIDHVLVDTGSVGLRILSSVLNASLLSALPLQTDASANPVGECYGFVDGYVFGSVRSADMQLGGGAVAGMPLQVVGDGGAFSTVPSTCSSGGGDNLTSVSDLAANGIIGISVTATDCGANCTVSGGYGAATYYDCPSSGCAAIIARSSSATAPFQQLPNPIAALSVDNNGSILSLPAVAASGQASATGTLIFGIGTETNNALGSATVLTTTTSTSSEGAGFITAIYKGQTLDQSYIDSGTTLYLFTDSTIPTCTGQNYSGFYCPASAMSLSPQLQGLNGLAASGAFTLYNAQTLLESTNSALPGIGGSADVISNAMAIPRSFAFGLPFFYGRNVYTAIEGRNAGGTVGPFFAF